MGALIIWKLITALFISSLGRALPRASADTTVLSTLLTPTDTVQPLQTSALFRQGRSGYPESRYGTGRGFLERLTQYDHMPSKCSRCSDDRYPDDRALDRDRDQYDRSNRDRYDDDRRPNHRPTYGSRYDRNDDDDDRRGQDKRNGTDGDDDRDRKNNRRPQDDDRRYDDKRVRYPERNRYGNRDDYFDRFLPRDPYASDGGYRRPHDRYDERYGDAGGGGRYPADDSYRDDYDRRRPAYDDRAYDDRAYGTYDRYPAHDSFRPWDETYRGSSGFDAGGRGYYFASGRPDAGAAGGWGARPDARYPYDRYDRPDLGYGSYGRPDNGRPDVYDPYARPSDPYARPSDPYARPSDPYARPSDPYARPSDPYARPADAYERPNDVYGRPADPYDRPRPSDGYGRPPDAGRPTGSGWHDVNDKRPPTGWHSAGSGWRDQSSQGGGGRGGSGGGQAGYGQTGSGFGQTGAAAAQPGAGGSTGGYGHSSTTPATSYLYQRENEEVTLRTGAGGADATRDDRQPTTKPPS